MRGNECVASGMKCRKDGYLISRDDEFETVARFAEAIRRVLQCHIVALGENRTDIRQGAPTRQIHLHDRNVPLIRMTARPSGEPSIDYYLERCPRDCSRKVSTNLALSDRMTSVEDYEMVIAVQGEFFEADHEFLQN